jgi:hypothetical protein
MVWDLRKKDKLHSGKSEGEVQMWLLDYPMRSVFIAEVGRRWISQAIWNLN